MKKLIALTVATALCAAMLSSCGASKDKITVVSRESGSGTRGAFTELFGIEEKDADGKKVDKTTDKAETTSSTSVMMTTIAGNEYAIGYISLGSLNSTVKAVKIDGVMPSVENINNGTYKISRPFNIATKGTPNETTQDFIDFIMSSDGQAVVEKAGYIKVDTTSAYTGTKPSGKITIAGSSSVTPVMEKLKEAYLQINPNATIEIQQNDSTTGMNSAIEGICDIGMASRELKESEISGGLTNTVIAKDGIVVIVHKDCEISELSSSEVKDIFTGKVTSWDDVK